MSEPLYTLVRGTFSDAFSLPVDGPIPHAFASETRLVHNASSGPRWPDANVERVHVLSVERDAQTFDDLLLHPAQLTGPRRVVDANGQSPMAQHHSDGMFRHRRPDSLTPMILELGQTLHGRHTKVAQHARE